MCGASNERLTCTHGLCCSQAGYCGNTTSPLLSLLLPDTQLTFLFKDYCDGGCQSAYGTCNANATQTVNCGPSFGNAICTGDQCCSVGGYCGSTEDYCADPGNCQLGYGRCDSDATPAGQSTVNVSRPLKGPITYTDDIIDCVEDSVIAVRLLKSKKK